MSKKSSLYPYQVQAIENLIRALERSSTGKFLVTIPTGGGKTRVINDFLMNHFLKAKAKKTRKQVLWIANKSWELLAQAADDVANRYGHRAVCLSSVGTGLAGELGESYDADIIYTTIHTFHERKKEFKKNLSPDLIVVDELDLGEFGKRMKSLFKLYEGRVPIVGLTATPHDDSQFRKVYNVTFRKLVKDGYLAKPIPYYVRTNINWAPELRNGFVTEKSFEELDSDLRNEIIVRAYSPSEHGKTLVFALNVDHANRLTQMFRRIHPEVGTEAIHIRVGSRERKEILRRFRANQIQVLINVEMVTRGVDVPDIETIFMARPTESARLFIQMIGRGARKIKGSDKETFNLVEFTDNIHRYGEYFVSSGTMGFGKGKEINSTVGSRAVAGRQTQAKQGHLYSKSNQEAVVALRLTPNDIVLVEGRLRYEDALSFVECLSPQSLIDLARHGNWEYKWDIQIDLEPEEMLIEIEDCDHGEVRDACKELFLWSNENAVEGILGAMDYQNLRRVVRKGNDMWEWGIGSNLTKSKLIDEILYFDPKEIVSVLGNLYEEDIGFLEAS
ncbi:MAG: DEAD/DEAH box helicase [Bdellovibrionales bacterium]|nr:DEAD/DEAH box helicase [Bdellovibrionales bacterium]